MTETRSSDDHFGETSVSPTVRKTHDRSSVDLVVSIINYRTPELTLDCLRSVIDCKDEAILSIVVIDNASGDGSATIIEAWIAAHPSSIPVTLIQSDLNLGFAGGHNRVMRTHPADHYLLLNSDTVLRADALRHLLDAADTHPSAGLLAPRLEDPDGTGQISCFRPHTPMSELIRGAASGPVTRFLARYDLPLGLTPDPDAIGWVSFACVLIRHEVIKQLNGLDDNFFLYYEDAEFCHRATKAGWQIVYVPDARVVHFRGGSGPVKKLSRAAKRLPSYYYFSRTRYYTKLYGRAGLAFANCCWGLGRLIALSRWLIRKPVPKAGEFEWRDIWIGFGRAPLSLTHKKTDI